MVSKESKESNEFRDKFTVCLTLSYLRNTLKTYLDYGVFDDFYKL